MLIQDICKACGLTKKAVEYYEKQGLIQPRIGENGYRHFTEEDAALLKEISLLRKLGIGIADIKAIMASGDKCRALSAYKEKMEFELEKMKAQYAGLNYLLDSDYDLEKAAAPIGHMLDENTAIKDRLEQAFPGNYGLYFSLHFGRFLNEKIDSDEKRTAYRAVISFLDGLENVDFPEELAEYLAEGFDHLKSDDLQKLDMGMHSALDDYEGFMEKNRTVMEEYLAYCESEEYKASPAYKMKQALLKLHKSNGYYDSFIPALKALSGSYREYCEKMEAANERFLKDYPQYYERIAKEYSDTL